MPPVSKKARKDHAAELPEDNYFVFGDEPVSKARSIPLVTFENDKFDVNAEAIELLQTLTAPLAVVVVAGLYRTGKSFLLNRVILGKQNAFTVGPTTRACTKGIWLWSEPLTVTGSDGKEVKMVVLDTEGIGAPTADATHDTRIFALGLLLATYFIYNSVGSIDEQALTNMSLVTNLSNQIRRENDQSSMEYPAFLWVVRDFALQLQSASGHSISPTEYLEDALKDCDANHATAASKNQVRASLRDFFPVRDCFTLVRPCTMENQLQTLDQLPNRALRPEFVTQAVELRQRIFHEAGRRQFKLNGVELNGNMLGVLCKQYVDAINQGQVPVIKDAWTYVCDAQRLKCEEAIVSTCMTSCASFVGTATSHQALDSLCQELCDSLLGQFRDTCSKLYSAAVLTTFLMELDARLKTIVQSHKAQFNTKYHSMIGEWVFDHLSALESSLMKRDFADIGAFRQATEDLRASFVSQFGNCGDSVWFQKLEPLLWRAMVDYFGGREQELNLLKAEHERTLAKHASEVDTLKAAHASSVGTLTQSYEQKVSHLEAHISDLEDGAKHFEERVTSLSSELLSVTESTSAQVATLEQELDRERLKGAAAEREMEQLREELSEVSESCRIVHEQTRQLSEATLERDRLRTELFNLKREFGDERKSFQMLEQSLVTESRELQAKALESLNALKEAKRLELHSIKQAMGQCQLKCTTLEQSLAQSGDEVAVLRASVQELQRAKCALEESEARLLQAVRDGERTFKEKERALEQALAKTRDERVRVEQDHLVKLQQLETRAVRAELSDAERRRQLELAEERWQRKRARTDDDDSKSLEVVKKDAELSWLRQQKQDADTQIVALRKHNDELQSQKRTLERELDSRLTRLTFEYEAKLAAVEKQKFSS